MALDPAARELIEQSSGGGRLEELPVEEARRVSHLLAAEFDGPAPPDVATEDVEIAGPDGPVPARLYRGGRAGAAAPPLLLTMHGGGWVLGSVDEHDRTSRRMADVTGALVLSVGYRLAPEHPFPAALEDCYAALRWAAAGAGGRTERPARVAVSGHSAGANLAAAVALVARDRGGPDVAFQLLVCPPLDATRACPSYRELADGYLLTASAMAWFWDHYLPPGTDPRTAYASPLHAPHLGGLPPALVVTAAYDPLRDEAELYAARLRAAGVDAVARRYEGMVHGFFSMPHRFATAWQATEDAAAAVRAALGLGA